MPTYISLLRGINVGGHRKVRMADLAATYKGLGFKNVRTYVQSGNVVFDAGARSASRVAALIEEQVQESFGFAVTVIVRTPSELSSIIEGNPFSAQSEKDPTKVSVMFLASRPSGEMVECLGDLDAGDDEFHVLKREVFLHYPNGCRRTKLTSTLFERKLKMPTTTRNWRTVEALHGMAVGSSAA